MLPALHQSINQSMKTLHGTVQFVKCTTDMARIVAWSQPVEGFTCLVQV